MLPGPLPIFITFLSVSSASSSSLEVTVNADPKIDKASAGSSGLKMLRGGCYETVVKTALNVAALS